MSSPVSFSDSELDVLMTLAGPVPPSRCAEYFEAVAELMAHYPERGDGLVHRLAVELQSRFMHAPPRLNGGIPRSRR